MTARIRVLSVITCLTDLIVVKLVAVGLLMTRLRSEIGYYNERSPYCVTSLRLALWRSTAPPLFFSFFLFLLPPHIHLEPPVRAVHHRAHPKQEADRDSKRRTGDREQHCAGRPAKRIYPSAACFRGFNFFKTPVVHFLGIERCGSLASVPDTHLRVCVRALPASPFPFEDVHEEPSRAGDPVGPPRCSGHRDSPPRFLHGVRRMKED